MESIILAKPHKPPFLLVLLFFFFSLSLADDILTRTERLRDGETLVSARGTFELGFFSPGESTHRYLGIWYKHIPIQTVVWVANRANPILDRSGLLQHGPAGGLLLTNGTGGVVWSTGPGQLARPVAQILDSGNFVLRDASDAHLVGVAWQSFHCPTDTWLPGMRFSSRFTDGLTAWRSADDAGLGEYTVRLDDRGMPQIVLLGRSSPVYRAGPWNGLRLSGVPEMQPYKSMFSNSFVSNANESYYEEELNEPGIITRVVLDPSGSLRRFVWINGTGTWNVYWSDPRDMCDVYGSCGAYGVCNSEENPFCKCLKGFEPRSESNWAAGCVRRTPLECGDRDGFWRVAGLKLPDTATAIVDWEMGLEQCRVACAGNCSCVAYTSADISRGGNGCVMWVDELTDLREFASGGQELYVRMAASDLGEDDESGQPKASQYKSKFIIIMSISATITLFFLDIYLCYLWRKKRQDRVKMKQTEGLSRLNFRANVGTGNMFIDENMIGDGENSGVDLTSFSFATIAAATNQFSDTNKLGEGGFGVVYKGILPNRQEAAVKRLTQSSGQGLEEFTNEVMSIARLQHVNLVRLLGVCVEGEETMLIYEYLPNKGLDSILFDPTKAANLDWSKRVHIIEGIAQGLLYLHRYSWVRIIHRDLKASNVLLDADSNPKISDFGMARIFGGDQNKERTDKIVGTLGYMSPEYAIRGLFSEKSDVFSFGVLLLEIVSGKKNSSFERRDDSWNLLQYAWKLWVDDRALELVDPTLGGTYSKPEVLNCINVGLLCVQQSVKDRPTKSTVVSLLGGNATLPEVRQPAFLTRLRGRVSVDLGSQSEGDGAANDVTITLIEPR